MPDPTEKSTFPSETSLSLNLIMTREMAQEVLKLQEALSEMTQPLSHEAVVAANALEELKSLIDVAKCTNEFYDRSRENSRLLLLVAVFATAVHAIIAINTLLALSDPHRAPHTESSRLALTTLGTSLGSFATVKTFELRNRQRVPMYGISNRQIRPYLQILFEASANLVHHSEVTAEKIEQIIRQIEVNELINSLLKADLLKK